MSLFPLSKRPLRNLAVIVLVVALTSSLSACGRRGALEPPPNLRGPSSKNGDQAQPGQDKALQDKTHTESKRGPVISKKPFILDPLL